MSLEVLGWLVGPDWYEQYYKKADKQGIASGKVVLLLGSSKTAAAIDPAQLSGILTKEFGQPIRVFNMSFGQATMVVRYFYLKHLLAQRKTFKNLLVVVEAPHGYPNLSTWSDPWIGQAGPGPLIPFLEEADLLKIWNVSSMPIETKLKIVLGKYLQSAHYFERYRGFCGDLFKLKAAVDIAAVADIRRDPDTVLRIRKIMSDTRYKAKVEHFDNVDLHDTAFYDLVQLGLANGARIFTYVPPSSSVDKESISCGNNLTLKKAYADYCRKSGIVTMPCGVALTDTDFPDLIHIRKSLCSKITAQLAAELAIECRENNVFQDPAKLVPNQ